MPPLFQIFAVDCGEVNRRTTKAWKTKNRVLSVSKVTCLFAKNVLRHFVSWTICYRRPQNCSKCRWNSHIFFMAYIRHNVANDRELRDLWKTKKETKQKKKTKKNKEGTQCKKSVSCFFFLSSSHNNVGDISLAISSLNAEHSCSRIFINRFVHCLVTSRSNDDGRMMTVEWWRSNHVVESCFKYPGLYTALKSAVKILVHYQQLCHPSNPLRASELLVNNFSLQFFIYKIVDKI